MVKMRVGGSMRWEMNRKVSRKAQKMIGKIDGRDIATAGLIFNITLRYFSYLCDALRCPQQGTLGVRAIE